ncbi:MAG: hypothetical protein Q9Q13_07935 [Acidobacteriota bacterium]|nr:hypothetical protein [Acidobacteriota bacterium]
MKLLFWIEPLVEMGRPLWKSAWITEFAAGMAQALGRSGSSGSDEIVVAAGAHLLEAVEVPAGTRAVAFEERDMRSGLERLDALEITSGWYLGAFDEGQLDLSADVVRDRLGGFEPEVVITQSPAPYLGRAFPRALILHREYGPFSRKPFTKTWYLDPAGMYRQGFPQRFAGEIAGQPAPTEEERASLEAFRRGCFDLLARRNPFRWWLQRQRDRFQHLVLLPLQFFGYYAIDANCPWTTPWHQIVDILERVPREIGVVVTTHPEYNLLDDETVACLRRRYPHFLFHEYFENTYACSQYLLPETDALLTVSSALGWQALVWKIPLIALGPCYQALARGGLDDLESILASPVDPGECWPRWLLGHYAIPEAYFHDGAWLRGFLERSRARHRQDALTATFFDPIAPLQEILEHHLAQLDTTIPHPGYAPSRDRLLERYARLRALHADPPPNRVAIEHAVEETLASALTWARSGRWTRASDSLAGSRSHLQRMLQWVEANLALVGQASAAQPAAEAVEQWLEQAESLEDPAAAAQIVGKVLSLPSLGGTWRARGERLLSRLNRRAGRFADSLDHLLRALAADPFQEVAEEAIAELLVHPQVQARGRMALHDLGLDEPFCLHLALAPPPADQRWPGWAEALGRVEALVLYAGPAAAASAVEGLRVLDSPGGALTAALLERALVVFVEDPASAGVCRAAGAPALFLVREGWDRGAGRSCSVESLTGPWGRLRDLEPVDLLQRVEERLPGLTRPPTRD